MKNISLSIFGIILLLFISFGLYQLFSQNNSETNSNHSSSEKILKKQEKMIKDKGYLTEGNRKSNIHVVTFTDYRCPHCSDYHFNQKKDLLDAYIRNNKIQYTEIPLPVIDKESTDYEKMAMVFAKNKNINQFNKFTDKAYQSSTIDNDPIKTVDRVDISTKDKNKIINEFKHSKFKSNKNKIKEKFNIHSTPTIYVNGKKVNNVKSLKKMIEKERK